MSEFERNHGRLPAWAELLDAHGWAAVLLDAAGRVAHVTAEACGFLGETDPERLGSGLPIAEALLLPTWERNIEPASFDQLVRDLLPYFATIHPGGVNGLGRVLPEPWRRTLSEIAEAPPPSLLFGTFQYCGAGEPAYPVKFVVFTLREADGSALGTLIVTDFAASPTQVALLVRGDQDMYARMAQLIEPTSHQAAILFADLPASGELSRRLPSKVYFQLIRALTTRFDEAVASEGGVVGKHAGDGLTAFFIADQCGGPVCAATAAVRTMRDLQTYAPQAASQVAPAVPKPRSFRFDAGLHWGANLYMGQLVPQSRLDVTALGDEVNECARIQQTADGGQVLASKAFVELVEPSCLWESGIHPTALVYRPLGDLSSASEKSVRDAGLIPVVELPLAPT